MKKVFAFISILAVACAALFAEVTAKKNADGSYEVTFFYGNPRATEVLLAGSFTDWQNGALPMEKGDKGFSLTKTFPAGTEKLTYKYISDGNWTTDLKAPEFVDDGFGGKNSLANLPDMVGGDSDDSAKAKINFISWTMVGVQANYITQGKIDQTQKGLDLDSVTLGAKSYNKFAGKFLPGCPLYVEIALAETDPEDYSRDVVIHEKDQIVLFSKDANDNETVKFEDGFKDLVNGLTTNPVSYLARSTVNNDPDNKGPGSNAFLGHLKFGFNTPYVNYVTGFNYAKPDVRKAITWTTVDGGWDAGYHHIGGFNVFSIGDKAVAFLEEKTGMTFDAGFAPNRTGDRKGTKYGYWGWAGVKKDNLAVDFQSNGMYNDAMFENSIEHDFIIGAKDKFELDAGKISVAVQGLVATHQADSDEIKKYNAADGNAGNVTDYFGYSTDVFYRSGDFDGIKNMAGNVTAGFENDMFNATVEYRFRGAEASMLYVRENHDDGTFDLSEQLGCLNTQKITVNATVTPMDALSVGLEFGAEMPFEVLDSDEDVVKGWNSNVESWYLTRCGSNVAPAFLCDNGTVEFTIKPTATYALSDTMSVTGYVDMNYAEVKSTEAGVDEDEASKYECSDSKFRVKKAGVSFAMTSDNDIFKGVNVFYGLDLSNTVKHFNTLVAEASFAGDIKADLAFGIKSENTLSKDESFDEDVNNPFAFALGVSKKFKACQKPVVYAQFVYNMDPFNHFGSGHDGLNLDRANVKGSWAKEGAGDIDAVDYYDGRAALRCGIRWDI